MFEVFIKVANDSSYDWQDAWDSGALLFPRAAICFLTNVAKSLFSSRGSTSLPGTVIFCLLHFLNKLPFLIYEYCFKSWY